MDISLAQKNSECCGCGICALVCPVDAISMVPRELGCLYPRIDPEKCVGCHTCENVCAYTKPLTELCYPQRAYAAAAGDDTMLKKSASGGVAAMLTHNVLGAGGVVCGCAMEMENGCLKPKHIIVRPHEKAEKLQGSKYVQSDLKDTFLQIRQLLTEGRTVLFSGTPCQVNALKHYLKDTDTTRLYTMDLICHGVPGAELFRGYLQHLAEHKKGTVTSFAFRDKTYGWGLQAWYSLRDRKGTEKTGMLPTGLSSYYTFFLESEIYRESCYSCPYAGLSRVGDITVGDFWGIRQEHPELLWENGGMLNENKGISAVLVNTEKGEKLLAEYGADMILEESSPERIAKWNSQLRKAAQHTRMRGRLTAAWHSSKYKGIEKEFRKKLGVRYPIRVLKNKLRKHIH